VPVLSLMLIAERRPFSCWWLPRRTLLVPRRFLSGEKDVKDGGPPDRTSPARSLSCSRSPKESLTFPKVGTVVRRTDSPRVQMAVVTRLQQQRRRTILIISTSRAVAGVPCCRRSVLRRGFRVKSQIDQIANGMCAG